MTTPPEVRQFVFAMVVVLTVTVPIVTLLDWVSSALTRRRRGGK